MMFNLLLASLSPMDCDKHYHFRHQPPLATMIYFVVSKVGFFISLANAWGFCGIRSPIGVDSHFIIVATVGSAILMGVLLDLRFFRTVALGCALIVWLNSLTIFFYWTHISSHSAFMPVSQLLITTAQIICLLRIKSRVKCRSGEQ